MCTRTAYTYTACAHNYTSTDPCLLLPQKHYPKPGKVVKPYQAKGHGYVTIEVKRTWCEECEWEKTWRKRASKNMGEDEGDSKTQRTEDEEVVAG
jgi:hypothetical protein